MKFRKPEISTTNVTHVRFLDLQFGKILRISYEINKNIKVIENPHAENSCYWNILWKLNHLLDLWECKSEQTTLPYTLIADWSLKSAMKTFSDWNILLNWMIDGSNDSSPNEEKNSPFSRSMCLILTSSSFYRYQQKQTQLIYHKQIKSSLRTCSIPQSIFLSLLPSTNILMCAGFALDSSFDFWRKHEPPETFFARSPTIISQDNTNTIVGLLAIKAFPSSQALVITLRILACDRVRGLSSPDCWISHCHPETFSCCRWKSWNWETEKK